MSCRAVFVELLLINKHVDVHSADSVNKEPELHAGNAAAEPITFQSANFVCARKPTDKTIKFQRHFLCVILEER